MIKQTNLERQPEFWSLLLLADPDVDKINSYLNDSQIFISETDTHQINGVLVLKWQADDRIELMNVAVLEASQGNGIGAELISFALQAISHEQDNIDVIVKTGDTSISAIKLYQKMGFKISAVEENYFIKNYPEPIYENGERLKHQIILSRKI